jgi:hypothetical protein
MEPLAPLNAALEASGALPDGAWLDWLWRADPEEPLSPAVLLNRSHLLGLLVCRHQGRCTPPAAAAAAAGGVATRVRLLDTPPEAMSLRELRDTVDNLLLEWAPFLRRTAQNPDAPASLAAVVRLVDGCFARLGRLAETPGPPAVFNDSASTEPHEGDDTGLLRMTRPCLRRLLNAFLVLYRHLHLLSAAEAVPPEPYECGVCRHHVEASMDEYHMLCMSMTLPVAARITYKHDFPGMYNHVSQVRPGQKKSDWRAGARTRDLGPSFRGRALTTELRTAQGGLACQDSNPGPRPVKSAAL